MGQNRVGVKRTDCNDEGVGSNPAATRNENRTLGGPLHRGCAGGPTGSEWETSDGKAELDL